MSRGGGWAGAGASSSSYSSSGRGASAGARSRQWYDQYDPSGYRSYTGETADTIDDSFSKIFNDLVGTVATKGGRGIFEDFVEFLEQGIDGFGDESNSEFEEILRSDLGEIQAEVENLNFLILKLREKLQRAQIDKMMAESELRTLNAAAARDIGTVDKNLEVVERAAATKARVEDLQGHIKRADTRQRRLMLRAEELRWGPGGRRPAYEKYANPGVKGSASTRSNTNTAGGASSAAGAGARSTTSSSSSPTDRNRSVEEELAKLKKQMGL